MFGFGKTQKQKWEEKSDMGKRMLFVGYAIGLTGKKIDPQDEEISYAVNIINTAYRENSSADNVKPIEIFNQYMASVAGR